VNKYVLPHSRSAYAQSGEDLILANLFAKLGIAKPTYIDIGANHPSFISNTYYFYLRGSSGLCIEPNPVLAAKLRRARPRDTVLNVGVGVTSARSADFYQFPYSAHGLGTFSKKEADYWASVGMRGLGKINYEKVIQVPLASLNDLMTDYLTAAPAFVSLDVEGMDLPILESVDFDRAPRVWCIETLGYDDNQGERKETDIIDFMVGRGYSVYADTHINTIFLRP
jgi:FkbM family methyltransferase